MLGHLFGVNKKALSDSGQEKYPENSFNDIRIDKFLDEICIYRQIFQIEQGQREAKISFKKDKSYVQAQIREFEGEELFVKESERRFSKKNN